MDYNILKEELSLPEYVGSADDKRQHYNAKEVSILEDVSINTLQSYLLPEGIMPILTARALEVSDINAQKAAQEILNYFSPTIHLDSINVMHPRFVAGLEALKTIGDVTQTQYDYILSLGTRSVHVSETKPGLPRTILTRHVIAAIGGV